MPRIKPRPDFRAGLFVGLMGQNCRTAGAFCEAAVRSKRVGGQPLAAAHHGDQPGACSLVAERWVSVAEGLRMLAERLVTLAEPLETVAEHPGALAEHVAALAEPLKTVTEHPGVLAEHVAVLAEPLETVAEPLGTVAEYPFAGAALRCRYFAERGRAAALRVSASAPFWSSSFNAET